MPFSFELGSLRLAYRRHEVSPVSVIREVTARIAARGDDAVWILRVPDDVLLAEAAALERRADRDELPLYGIPFAVKDNIDAAGLPTTAGCPEFAYMPARSAPVLEYLRRAGALPCATFVEGTDVYVGRDHQGEAAGRRGARARRCTAREARQPAQGTGSHRASARALRPPPARKKDCLGADDDALYRRSCTARYRALDDGT